MYSEWIDKRFVFKEILKHNTAMIILAIIDIAVGIIFMLLPSENNSGESSVNSVGYIFIFLGIGLILICIATLILFSANRTISKLKKTVLPSRTYICLIAKCKITKTSLYQYPLLRFILPEAFL